MPVEQWLIDLGRIEQAATRIRAPLSYASEACTLREHIGLVRHAVMAKVQGVATNADVEAADAATELVRNDLQARAAPVAQAPSGVKMPS
ncbi:hypothetical protein QTI66_38250 [Variovorax sp. J22R133]|uniref:hypothetical protein n=1 Tax=Variovorax brevis TaxID=3053503 RepID=UPI002576654A|nr:hypothetical protein [Variovorax sp. J22R133]MDM0117933.1 hypothetical protein [Variovorax sp. J22R133]